MTSGLKGLAGKNGIVTGGASGIGLATARRLALEGVRVAILDIDLDGARKAADLVGGGAIGLAADMADSASVAGAFAEAAAQMGGIQLLHNNAAVGSEVIAGFLDFPEDYFDRVMAVNVRGVWSCTREAVRHMTERKLQGAIVNMSSVSGIRGTRGGFAYAASKHAVIGLTTSIAAETAAQGIRINAVCPGNTDTPALRRVIGKVGLGIDDVAMRNPMPRVAQPDEQAAMVCWLLSDEASYVTGGTFVVDGGASSIIMY